jgi:hypothetical protein
VATDPATPAATGGGAVAAPSDTSGVPAIVWLALLLGGLAAGGLLALRVWLKRLR